MRFWVVWLALVASCMGLKALPVLVASHKVVPGLKSEISTDNSHIHNITSVTNMVKKLITQCSADEYIIINQPGLSYTDLTENKKDDWSLIRKYLILASTIIGLPRVAEPLDLDYIERYIIRNCDAELIKVVNDDENEVRPYYDVRARVIRIDLSPLPEDAEERSATIREHDDLIRKIIRKLPSPHYNIIMTSSTLSSFHPVPASAMKKYPKDFEIFNDIVNDPSRLEEIERNNNFHKVEPYNHVNKHTNERYLKNKKKDEIHLFDNELWVKHERLVTTILVMVATLFTMKTINVVNALKSKITKKKAAKSNGKGIIAKKQD
ncbi:BIG1-domain-containing protein [Suhomyces tanzawaensis NRRL Y-17324]|uniref:Protein BIG1 n=1 Tax=Suhomyces tanzawaensis NRRL Y-17324 TaxID=984487 RepID=A0A1E4SN87_9ASCO|nr:BIG1-domain-containing protein [Suhomyces tanzawaensis NRRL Y-17324]ODV80989.1 BIG1-domain-containing protein [Suhomyces tanzawaensis NRRL Y-17324]